LAEFSVIDNHSVALGLLNGGPVLDAGARGFEFTDYFITLGHRVVALDPSLDADPIKPIKLPSRFYRYALVGPNHPNLAYLRMTEDPEARNITYRQERPEDPTVLCLTIKELMELESITEWDLIKLNIEGAEYDVLAGLDRPVARQIVFSMHEHTPQAKGKATCDHLISKLSLWYIPFNVTWEKKFGCSENYWDVVLIRKDLI